LRTKADRQALREAVLDGTVDCIASHHIPHHTDNKVVEFEYARPGMISLETAFSVVRTSLPSLSLEQLISLFSTAPREIFGLQPVAVAKGNAASLSLFFPHEQWVPDTVFSRSKNSPFTGLQLTGFPVGIINRDKVILRSL
jgi:dihydroorotase